MTCSEFVVIQTTSRNALKERNECSCNGKPQVRYCAHGNRRHFMSFNAMKLVFVVLESSWRDTKKLSYKLPPKTRWKRSGNEFVKYRFGHVVFYKTRPVQNQRTAIEKIFAKSVVVLAHFHLPDPHLSKSGDIGCRQIFAKSMGVLAHLCLSDSHQSKSEGIGYKRISGKSVEQLVTVFTFQCQINQQSFQNFAINWFV